MQSKKKRTSHVGVLRELDDRNGGVSKRRVSVE